MEKTVLSCPVLSPSHPVFCPRLHSVRPVLFCPSRPSCPLLFSPISPVSCRPTPVPQPSQCCSFLLGCVLISDWLCVAALCVCACVCRSLLGPLCPAVRFHCSLSGRLCALYLPAVCLWPVFSPSFFLFPLL